MGGAAEANRIGRILVAMNASQPFTQLIVVIVGRIGPQSNRLKIGVFISSRIAWKPGGCDV